MERFLAIEGTQADSQADQLAQLDTVALRERASAARSRFTVEANIERITALHDTVVGQ